MPPALRMNSISYWKPSTRCHPAAARWSSSANSVVCRPGKSPSSLGSPRRPFSTPPSSAVVLRPEKQILADGSVVELKSGAEIAVDFTGAYRRVALKRGEAHFQVAHQSRPFVVTAGPIEFRAVGTAFAVHR